MNQNEMIYFALAAAVLCAWSLLRNLGNERQVRINSLRVRIEPDPEPVEPPARK